jgi:hypothetical protein
MGEARGSRGGQRIGALQNGAIPRGLKLEIFRKTSKDFHHPFP